jgi:hypothetical protein
MTEEEFNEEVEKELETLIHLGLVERFIREDGQWVYAPTANERKSYDK